MGLRRRNRCRRAVHLRSLRLRQCIGQTHDPRFLRTPPPCLIFIQRIDFDHGLNPDILKYVYGNNNPNGDLLHNFDKGEDFNIVFSKCYTEKIANILVMSRALYRIFNSVENNNWTENEDKKAIYQKYANKEGQVLFSKSLNDE